MNHANAATYAEELARRIGGNDESPYHNDPVRFAWEAFRVRVTKSQAAIMNAIAQNPKVAVKSGHKTGKALALDTPIPTPSGWTTQGELRPGDEVFDERGQVCRVLSLGDVLHNRPCFRVRFCDGTEIIADAAHEWLTQSAAARRSAIRAKKPRVTPSIVTTQQMASTIQSKNRGREHAIQIASPLELPVLDLPIDPYVLGVWLGDGTSADSAFTSADQDIVSQVQARGYTVAKSQAKGAAALYRIRDRSGETLRASLRSLNVFGNKHIPPAYKRASIGQRLDLLRGLMDTDGYCCARQGTVEFCNTNRRLAEDVFELAASLGFKPHLQEGRATLRGRDISAKFRVCFTPHSVVFNVARKADRQHGGKTKSTWVRQRMVVSVEPVPSVPVRCIMVDSPSHLYLCSRAMIPTHNSTSIAMIAWWWAYTRRKGRVICTSSVDRQVRDVIWYEVLGLWRRWARRQSETSIELPEPAQLPAVGVRWPDGRQILGFTTRDVEGAAGYSSHELLYLVDEASGINSNVFDAFEGNLASGGRLAMFSNPTQPAGYFFDAFHRNHAEFVRFTLRSTETPNAISGKRVVPGMAEREWCEARARAWGIDSAAYQVRVLGEFPQQGDDAVVPMVLVQQATERWDRTPAAGALVAAIDVARFGSDESIIGFRRGRRVEPLIAPTENLDTSELASRFIREAEERRNGEAVEVRVDVTGVGAGTADALRAKSLHWLNVVDIVNASAANDDAKYANLRAEMWFSIKAFLEDGGALPQDDELDLELGAVKYKFKGADGEKFIVEPKDEIKKRIGRSPDRADCVSMLCWGAGDAPFEWGDEFEPVNGNDEYRLGDARGYG